MNFVDIYQKYWKNGYTLTDLSLSGIDREVFRSLFNPVAEVFRKYPAGDCHLYTFGPGVPILGPELVVNGDFSNGAAGWTVNNSSGSGSANISGGALTIVRVDGSNMGARVSDAFPTIPGTSYQVSFDVANAPAWVYKVGIAGASYPVGRNSFSFVATATTTQLGFEASGNGSTSVIDNVGCKAITGYSNTYSGFTAGNYFDSAGTTLASTDGSVGLVLDAAGSVGAEIVVNGFNSGWVGTGWTFGNGKAVATATTNNAFRGATLVAGKTYRVTVRCSGFTSGGYKILYEGGTSLIGDKSAVGTFTATVYAPSTGGIYIWANSALTAEFDYFSVVEVTGIHATQSTPGYKPTLRKGIVNLQAPSTPTAGGSWSANFGGTGVLPNITYNYASAPDGTSAARVQMDKGAGATSADYSQFTGPNATVVSGQPYTSALWIRTTDGISAKTVSLRDGVTYRQCSVTGAWQLFVINNSATGTIMGAGVRVRGTEGSDQTTDILVASAGVFQGTLTAAQILAAGGIPLTTTAPASSLAGVNYLEFDGVDDRLSLPPLGITDACTFVFAITPRAFDTRVIFSSDNAGPQLYLTTGGWLTFDKVGAGTLYSLNAGLQLDTAVVLSVRLAGGVVTIRKNGVVIGTTTSALTFTGTVNHSIGAQTAGAFAYKGLLHQFELLRFAASDADLAVLEKFVAQLSGVQV